MAGDAKTFALELDAEFREKVEDRLLEVVQKLGMELLQRIVMKTPVDTGRARGGWSVSIGNPSTGETGNIDRGGGETISRGAAVITGLTELQALWIVNNVEYVSFLEDGHSGQAPAGMVAVSLAEMQSFFARVQ